MAYDTINNTFTDLPAVQQTCWCGITFAIPKSLRDHYREANARQAGSYSLYCPLGHGMVPKSGHSEADKLRDELTREKHRREQAQAEAEYQRGRAAMKDRQIAARKGQMTKLRKRVERGVCPCCNRYFANLHRHMETKHADWRPEGAMIDLTPPAGLSAREQRAWLLGADAASGPNPYGVRTSGACLRRAWDAGREAATKASADE